MPYPVHQFETYIRTTPERLWQAGQPYRYDNPNGSALLSGEILETDPPLRFE